MSGSFMIILESG